MNMARRCEHMQMPRPRLAFTFNHYGKSDRWFAAVNRLEDAIYGVKHESECSSRIDDNVHDILCVYYTVLNGIKYEGEVIELIISQRLLCNILNGQNIRVFTDGSSE